MITVEQQKYGAKLMNTLAQKAWESSAFKEQLINNPVSTIESVTGQRMELDLKVVVEDQTDESIIYLNIPSKPDLASLELTDEQLEMVAGGTDFTVGLGYVAVVAICCVVAYAVGTKVGESNNTPKK